MKTVRTIIAGSRTIVNPAVLHAALTACPWSTTITEVVSGCADGVDTLGEQWAKRKMIPIKRFPADWRTYGKAAGPRRNETMARYADALIAVWDGQSRGTHDMIERAQRYGLLMFIYYLGDD